MVDAGDEGGVVGVEVEVEAVDVLEDDVEDVDDVEESDELEDLRGEESSEARPPESGGLGPPLPPAFDANSLRWKEG